LLPRGALQACVLPLEGCGPFGQRARRRVRDAVDEAGAHLGGVADPVGGEEGGHVTRGDAEHLGDDPRVVAWPGPVEEGLPVLAQREQRLGGAGSDRQEEYRNGEEPDAPRACLRHARPRVLAFVLTATPKVSVAPEEMPRQRS